MKNTTRFLKLLCAVSLFLSVKTSMAQCAVTFSYSTLPGGVVNFTATPTPSATQIFWNFGNGTIDTSYSPTLALTPSVTYSAGGNYIVSVTASNGCSATATQTVQVNISTSTVCALNAGMTAQVLNYGYVSFNNTTTGTVSALTSYVLDYGDGTSSGLLTNQVNGLPPHTYTANGVYTATLTANVSMTPACTSTAVLTYTVNSVCTTALSATLSTIQTAGTLTVTATTTGTLAGANYAWSIYDNGISSNTTTSGPQLIYTPSGNGMTNIYLSLTNPAPSCTASASQSITVNTSTLCNLNANMYYNQSAGATVYFYDSSTGVYPGTTYSWSFGDGTTGTGNLITHTYPANGTYTVIYSVNNNLTPTCVSTITNVIVVNSGCNLVSSFTYTIGSNGTVNFTNSSASTYTALSNTWYFGDGGSSTSFTPSHAYANGNYVVILISTTNGGCTDSTSQVVSISNSTLCNLSASFYYNQSPGSVINFYDNSTGIGSGTNYTWNFGDGTTGSGSTITHTYSANGNYTVSLAVTNGSICISTATNVVVAGSSCSLVAGFTYTVGANGNVNFTNTSAAAAGLSAVWNFGDGTNGSGFAPSHTYSNGTYIVNLIISDTVNMACSDTASHIVTVSSNTCVANASFSMIPSGTPHVWYAVPSSSLNVIAATWNWGDSTSTTGLFSNHTYTAAGNYDICLSVTVACGATASSCYTYNVYRSANDNSIIQVQVVNASDIATGIKTTSAKNAAYSVSPNPGSGLFNVNISGLTAGKASINVYNLVGKMVYESESETTDGTLSKEVNLYDLANGIYFMKINADAKTYTKKIIINK